MIPADLDESLACYAIGALDEEQRSIIDDYLLSHPEARDRLQQYRDAAGPMARDFEPPKRVWDAIAATAFTPEIHRQRHHQTSQRRRLRFPSPIVVVPAVVGAVVGVVVACVVLVVVLVASDRGADTPSADLPQSARAAERAPRARIVALRGLDGRMVASAVVDPDGTGYLTSHLVALEPGRTYQLWEIVDDENQISLGVLGSHPRVVAFSADGNVERLAVTDEAAPGVPVTHRAPVASGALRSA